MLFTILAAAAAAGTVAIPAAPAQDERAAYEEISQADYASAEAKLAGALRQHPYAPELMLNLAAVYAKTGRTGEARTLYTRVLAQPQAELILGDSRLTWSHDVARSGLRLLDRTMQLSAR
jgi:Flp pilus assembly protein TadD